MNLKVSPLMIPCLLLGNRPLGSQLPCIHFYDGALDGCIVSVGATGLWEMWEFSLEPRFLVEVVML